ncbi:hypothetical protein CJF42_25020 [Pseudoalteromonas sp. NBT06-2]|uniref:hypothetical protein n=1 Tax=Pseudoalteromonas sp. NBT06-2 TaxID=2025950 RepID=UPI000BA67A00|nr:hypothetical protein [Pseudoalteromonas sp. NBT06-2]PAJ71759.1 hypothetical protein CJF42_25020 [Pseudoalteromonas sp. NBT06-2]
MKKEISRNPSFTPSPSFRKNINDNKLGTTERLNQIWDRYEYLLQSNALHLEPEEKQVLTNILSGSFIEPSFIEHLAQEVIDSDDYIAGNEAAKSLYEKMKNVSYAEILATVERLGF